MENTGNGDKTAVTNYAEIPVEYLEIDGSTHYTTSTNLGNSTADARMLAIRYNGDVLIDAGATLTPTARKRGMFMYVDGALTVNGTISMTARGATASGDRILILTDSGTSYEIPAVGGAGGASRTAGGIGTNGQTGGGGGAYEGSGIGGAGTSYSGGAGAGTVGNSGSANGGAGGAAGRTGDGGGAGNPGGSPNGGTGTGGLLIIYAKTVVVSSTGSIQANGSTGGTGGSSWQGGAGSGGGSINIFYQNTLTNSGSIVSAAGGVSGSHPGATGGAGTVRSVQTSN
jgi:hypothetical protein